MASDFGSLIKGVLISFFPTGFFETKKGKAHPAFSDIQHLERWSSSVPGLALPEDVFVKSVMQVTDICLATQALLGACGGDPQSLNFEIEDLWGSNRYKNRLFSEIQEPSKYHDVLHEMYTGLQYRSQGAIKIGDDGQPDFLLADPPAGPSCWIECKNNSTDTDRRGLERIFEKANDQIKKSNMRSEQGLDGTSMPGILVLNLQTAGLGYRYIESMTDTAPVEVQSAKTFAESFFARSRSSGNFGSISRVVFLWHDYAVGLGHFGRSMIFLRVMNETIDHPNPRVGLASDRLLFAGSTVAVTIQH